MCSMKKDDVRKSDPSIKCDDGESVTDSFCVQPNNALTWWGKFHSFYVLNKWFSVNAQLYPPSSDISPLPNLLGNCTTTKQQHQEESIGLQQKKREWDEETEEDDEEHVVEGGID